MQNAIQNTIISHFGKNKAHKSKDAGYGDCFCNLFLESILMKVVIRSSDTYSCIQYI